MLERLDHPLAWQELGKLLSEIGGDALARGARAQAQEALTAAEGVCARISPLPGSELAVAVERLRSRLPSS